MPAATAPPIARCACGHTAGDHLSGGTTGLHAPRYGLCLIRGCRCRSFAAKDGSS